MIVYTQKPSQIDPSRASSSSVALPPRHHHLKRWRGGRCSATTCRDRGPSRIHFRGATPPPALDVERWPPPPPYKRSSLTYRASGGFGRGGALIDRRRGSLYNARRCCTPQHRAADDGGGSRVQSTPHSFWKVVSSTNFGERRFAFVFQEVFTFSVLECISSTFLAV